jgi:hypothetical protein
MRLIILATALALSACVAPSGTTTTSSLVAADASTSLIAGERLTAAYTTVPPEVEGADPVVTLTLRHADGRTMAFQEANHAPDHLRAQAQGGPLAQVMGLFGEEMPTLYIATPQANSGAAFLCAPDGPLSLGLYQSADGAVQVVGLQQEFQFEVRPDGSTEALPYSPDQVCARLRFRRD